MFFIIFATQNHQPRMLTLPLLKKQAITLLLLLICQQALSATAKPIDKLIEQFNKAEQQTYGKKFDRQTVNTANAVFKLDIQLRHTCRQPARTAVVLGCRILLCLSGIPTGSLLRQQSHATFPESRGQRGFSQLSEPAGYHPHTTIRVPESCRARHALLQAGRDVGRPREDKLKS